MFNDLRRSNAFEHLTRWKFNELIEDSDMESFTQETQKRVKTLLTLMR